eukprot:m.39201 g.39201  ORF g.39201 m.39201 type:complete len:433 (+) comp32686_c0_seq5:282-1580(+)
MGARRVVVTGLGIVSPLGTGAGFTWKRLVKGECGITGTFGKGYNDVPSQVAGFVPRGSSSGLLDVEKHIPKSVRKTVPTHTAFALAAADELLCDAGYSQQAIADMSEEGKERIGVAVGVGMVDLNDIAETAITFRDKGYKRVSPYFVPRILTNMVAGQISLKYGFKGPNHSVSTACATGAHAIGDAFRLIRNGDADAMVAGGGDSQATPLSMAGFCRARALTTKFNDCPEKASRPFDKDRDGFVMAEGCGLVFLEELERAKSRGVNIYAEIVGYGLSGDAHHITAPSEDGRGALNCMRAALRDARQSVDSLNYINAHATSTLLGDAAENRAIRHLIGSRRRNIAVSSTKGATGHLLGGAGSIEAIFTTLAVYNRILPPTINLERVSDPAEFDFNYVANEAQDVRDLDTLVALTNSFGFGGTNASLCFRTFST